MAPPNRLERGPLYNPDGTSGGGNSPDEKGSEIVQDLIHNLNRLKVWLALGKDDPSITHLLLDRDKVHAAAEALTEKGDDRSKKEALKALGAYDKAESSVQDKTLDRVLGIRAPKKNQTPPSERKEFESLWSFEHNGQTHSVEEWIESIRTEQNPDLAIINEIRQRMERVRDRYGVEELKGVELSAETLGEMENRIALMRARADFQVGFVQKELRKDKTSFEVTHGAEIRDDNGLLQVRKEDSTSAHLREVIDRVRVHASEDLTFEELSRLSEEDLIARFEDANELLAHMDHYYDKNISLDERKRLKYLLTSLQLQYQERLALKVAEQWKTKENKPDEWGEVASRAIERVMNNNRTKFSEKVELKGKDAAEKYENLRKEATGEGRKAIEQLKKAKWRVGKSTNMDVVDEPDDRQWNKTAQWKALDKKLDAILGGSIFENKALYNPFEDKDFWNDLAEPGESGIDKIVERAKNAGVQEEDKFRDILNIMKAGKEMSAMGARRRGGIQGLQEQLGAEGQLEILGELLGYLDQKDYGAAANKMLEYTTRVGMQENSNDLSFLYVRRMFLEKISHVSPDFAEQFQKNQALNYLPGLSAQKPEDFYGVQLKIFNKGNVDLFFGGNAFMSGNLIKLEDGREIVVSTKSFIAALRSERHQMRIFRAEPNTMDTTLQNILLEEMYGKGAHIEMKTEGKEQILYLALEGQTSDEWRKLSDVKISSRYARLGVAGFNGWMDYGNTPGNPDTGLPPTTQDGYQMSLEDILNRDQWMLRNAAQFMWYSEMWMDTLKSYQPAIMQNTAKSLEVAASAIADYKASFELVAPPYLDVVQKIGDMLGPMERYKAMDMVAINIADELTKSHERQNMDEGARQASRKRDEAIGTLFKKIFVRQTDVDVNGEKLKVNNRTRNREMTRQAFNGLQEFDADVAEIVRNRLLDMGHYPGDVPSVQELQNFYREWKRLDGTGRIPEGKAGYMGQEYAAVWQDLKELKMSTADQELWESLTQEELNLLMTMNEKVTGIHRDDITKENFFKNFEIEAFVDWTGTKHADDWEQFGMKYAPGKIEALKTVVKIAGGEGNIEDYVKLYDQLSLFATPEEKRIIMTILLERQALMTSEQWVVPYEVADVKPKYDKDGKVLRKGTAEIAWVTYTDSNGKTYFARTADGTRAYQKKMFRGNYARQILGKDMWRPHDIEMVLEYLRSKQILDKQEKYELSQKILGTRRGVEYFANGLAKRMGIPPERMKRFVDIVSRSSSWVKLQSLKLFFFQDPKWALWTFAEEVVGLSNKTFEQIFGFSVGGKH